MEEQEQTLQRRAVTPIESRETARIIAENAKTTDARKYRHEYKPPKFTCNKDEG